MQQRRQYQQSTGVATNPTFFTPAAWTGQEEKPEPPLARTNAVAQLVVATAWVLSPIVTTKVLNEQQTPSYPPPRTTTAIEQLLTATAWTGSPILSTKALPSTETPRPPVVPPIERGPEIWNLQPLGNVSLLSFFDQQQQRPRTVGRTFYAESGGDNAAGIAPGSIAFIPNDPPPRVEVPPPIPRPEVPWTLSPLGAPTLATFFNSPGAVPPKVPPIARGDQQAQPWGKAFIYASTGWEPQGARPPVIPPIERGHEQAQPFGSAVLYPYLDTPGKAPPVVPPIERGDPQSQPLSAAVLYPFLDSPGRAPPVAPPIERGDQQAQPLGSAVLAPYFNSPGALPPVVPRIARGDEQSRNLGKPFLATSTGWEPQGARPPVVPQIPKPENAKTPGQILALTLAASTGWEPQGARPPMVPPIPRLENAKTPGQFIPLLVSGWEPTGAVPRQPPRPPRFELASPVGSPIATLGVSGWEPTGQTPPRAAPPPPAGAFVPATAAAPTLAPFLDTPGQLPPAVPAIRRGDSARPLGGIVLAPVIPAQHHAPPRAPRPPVVAQPWALAPFVPPTLFPFLDTPGAEPPLPGPNRPQALLVAQVGVEAFPHSVPPPVWKFGDGPSRAAEANPSVTTAVVT